MKLKLSGLLYRAFFRNLLVATGLLAFTGAVTQAAEPLKYDAGAVFAATNDVKSNEVVMYLRDGSGKLKFVGRFPTGGRGEGGTFDPLQSENSLIVSADHRYLMVVNAGTSDISVFRITSYGLELASVTPSGGGNPVGLALHDDLLYVVNFGGGYHTAGFRVGPYGELTPVPHSKESLSTLDTGASSAAFAPDGRKLVVTERIANKVDVFTVNNDGSLAKPVYNDSIGVEPFGIQFTPSGVLLVTEASGSVSAYTIDGDNKLDVVTGKVSSSGGATCWIATDGTYAWVSNALSGTITAYSLDWNGALTAVGLVAHKAAPSGAVPPSSFPIDLALSSDNHYLYVFFSNLGKIVGYKVGDGGRLIELTSVMPEAPGIGAEGLAVY